MMAKKITVSPEIQAIEKFDLCLFNRPIVIDGVSYTGAKRVKPAVVRDRIDAVRWCKDELGFECQDGIIAGLATSTMMFGTVEGNTDTDDNGELIGPLTLSNEKKLAPDTIIDHFIYDDFITMSLLMGKPMPSPESDSAILLKSSNTQPTNESE